MLEHLPVLPVVVPLVAAPLGVMIGRPRVAWLLALGVTAASFSASVLLLVRVLSDGPISYHLGGWAPPFGIEYRVDVLNAFVLPIVSGVGLLAAVYAPRSLAAEVERSRHALFYPVFLLCLAGLLGMTVTGDAFNVFVFLEISSLATYALVALGPDRRSPVAAFRYLILGAVGGSLFLIGIGLLYMKTGTLNMRDLAERLPPIVGSPTVRAGIGFLAAGLSLKIALFPVHNWLPDAYTYAPSAVTSFVAATATKVAVYVALRFGFTVLGPEHFFPEGLLRESVLTLAVVGVFVASLAACFQRDVKRALAYSSVAQLGYIVVGVTLMTREGLVGGVVHVFNHALMKGGLFMALGCMALRVGGTTMEELRGIGRRMPLTTLLFVVGGLGMIGVPATVGFVSKWYLVLGALHAGRTALAVLMLLSSLLALVYIWRVVETAYFDAPVDYPEQDESKVEEAPISMLLPTLLLMAATVWFGLDTGASVGVAGRIADLLLGGVS